MSGDPASRRRRNRAGLCAAVSLFVLAAAIIAVDRLGGVGQTIYLTRLVYLQHVPPLFWPAEEFTPEAWQSSPPAERYRFAKVLVSKRLLIGRTPAEVASMLGGSAPDGEAWYRLRRVGLQNLWWVLRVEARDGRVVDVRCGMAFLDP
jgi:hypothetical protein